MAPKNQLLFIEDEGYVISRVNEILSSFPHFEVTRLDAAEPARAILEEKPFDIVITDIYLRGASGAELSFKALQKNKDACVIIITGLDNVELAAKAVKEGAFNFVVRPPGLDKLASILKLVTLVKGLPLSKDGKEQP